MFNQISSKNFLKFDRPQDPFSVMWDTTKIGSDRFSCFDVYWIQTNRQTRLLYIYIVSCTWHRKADDPEKINICWWFQLPQSNIVVVVRGGVGRMSELNRELMNTNIRTLSRPSPFSQYHPVSEGKYNDKNRQGYPQRMKLQIRLYKFYSVVFLKPLVYFDASKLN